MLPKKQKIGPYAYNVVARSVDDEDLYEGQFLYRKMELRVVNHKKEILVLASLLHESIEAINYQYELNLEHNTITILETALMSLMRDNPAFIKAILLAKE